MCFQEPLKLLSCLLPLIWATSHMRAAEFSHLFSLGPASKNLFFQLVILSPGHMQHVCIELLSFTAVQSKGSSGIKKESRKERGSQSLSRPGFTAGAVALRLCEFGQVS